jgi:hypothetical protein
MPGDVPGSMSLQAEPDKRRKVLLVKEACGAAVPRFKRLGEDWQRQED